MRPRNPSQPPAWPDPRCYGPIGPNEPKEVAMTGSVKAIPAGHAGATPYLCCRGAADAIEFYKKAFGASERSRMTEPDSRIGHAELTIGSAVIMLSDEY